MVYDSVLYFLDMNSEPMFEGILEISQIQLKLFSPSLHCVL